MKKIFEKAYADSVECRKLGRKSLIFSLVALCISLFVFYHINCNDITNLERTVRLDNGIVYNIKPSYKNGELRINLNVSRGWARLSNGENYYVHLVDSDGFDVAGIAFYSDDFSWDTDNVHRAYKKIAIKKNKLKDGVQFKMLYPAWVEDK